VRQLLVTGNVVPGSPIIVTLMMEALSSTESSVLTRTTRRNIQEDAILRSHCRENLKSYNFTLLFVEAHRDERRSGPHIFETTRSQMALRLLALHVAAICSKEDSWYSFPLQTEPT
jgi:hypothetical protein